MPNYTFGEYFLDSRQHPNQIKCGGSNVLETGSV